MQGGKISDTDNFWSLWSQLIYNYFPIPSHADVIEEVKNDKSENGLEQSETDSTEYTKTGQKYSLTLCPEDFTPPVSSYLEKKL